MTGADGKPNFSGFKHHAKVHSFRIGTAILTWLLLGAALFYRPEWIRWALRAGTSSRRSGRSISSMLLMGDAAGTR